MTKFYLIRHGQTAGNAKNQYIGSTDEPLCEEGREAILQRKENGEYPSAELLISSPMKRCLETAELIYPNEKTIQIENLKEIDFGRYEGKCFSELDDDRPYQEWLKSGGKIPFPDGENEEDFLKRILTGFEEVKQIAEEKDAKTVAIVTHGGVIMTLVAALKSPNGEELLRDPAARFRFLPKNGECVEIPRGIS